MMGDIMTTKNKPNAPKRPTLAEEVANIEGLSAAEIDAELESYGIDPEPAIRKVKAMVEDKLVEWRRRGILHRKEDLAHAGRGEN